jgi:hypothetical protein
MFLQKKEIKDREQYRFHVTPYRRRAPKKFPLLVPGLRGDHVLFKAFRQTPVQQIHAVIERECWR